MRSLFLAALMLFPLMSAIAQETADEETAATEEAAAAEEAAPGSVSDSAEESPSPADEAAPKAEPVPAVEPATAAPVEATAHELTPTETASATKEKAAAPEKSAGLKVGNDKPIKFFELYGFFAVNHYFTYNLFMNGNNPYLPTTPLANAKERGEKILSWGGIKLHLEPIINVAETMEIHTKITLMGSRLIGTDNALPETKENGLLPGTQLEVDPAIRIEGLWGTLDTPIGELRVGRMPFNWGLGMLYNDANTVETNTPGDYLDRIMFIVPVMGFKIIPAFDYISEGAMVRYNDHFIDASSRDDAWQVALMFTMQEEDPAVLEEKLLKESTVYEFGVFGSYSWKSDKATEVTTPYADTPVDGNIIDPAKTYTLSEQDARMLTLDAWGNIYYKNFSFKAELAFMDGKLGRFKNADMSHRISSQMFGAALEAQWKYIPRKLHFTFLTGMATGDKAAGVQGDSMNLPGKAIDTTLGLDMNVDNFRFHRDYNFNSFIWREVLGRFTSGYYLNLDTQYFFRDDISMRGGLTYSGAWFAKQTPGGKGSPLALEPYVGAYYSGDTGLRAGLTFQIAVPFDGLNTVARNTTVLFDIHTYLGFVF